MLRHAPLLERPNPDFAGLLRILAGEKPPDRVPLVELLIDSEILQAIAEKYLSQTWIPSHAKGKADQPTARVWLSETPPEAYYAQLVHLYYRLGYDYVPLFLMWNNHPAPERLETIDTADLSRGTRQWVRNTGMISNREEAEAFPWDRIEVNLESIRRAEEHLPPGMKLMVCGSVFEHVMKNLVGHEALLLLIADDPEFAGELYARWGEVLCQAYGVLLARSSVGGIFHGDDLGFRTSTVASAQFLRRHILPWLRRYAALAHAQGKAFWLHSCGQIFGNVIEDIIEDVRIDGLHSFQDSILPVTDFKARYGSRVGTLGGIDVDKLVRLGEPALRSYLRRTLDRCMPGGRYAFGSGNSIANYVPLRNYLIMLDEARSWRPTA